MESSAPDQSRSPRNRSNSSRRSTDQAAIAIRERAPGFVDAVERRTHRASRFVSPQVAALVSSRSGEQLLAGHRAYISCCFCDLRGFTAFAENGSRGPSAISVSEPRSGVIAPRRSPVRARLAPFSRPSSLTSECALRSTKPPYHVGGDGPPKALEVDLTDRRGIDNVLHFRKHTLTYEDLSGLCIRAEAAGRPVMAPSAP